MNIHIYLSKERTQMISLKNFKYLYLKMSEWSKGNTQSEG